MPGANFVPDLTIQYSSSGDGKYRNGRNGPMRALIALSQRLYNVGFPFVGVPAARKSHGDEQF